MSALGGAISVEYDTPNTSHANECAPCRKPQVRDAHPALILPDALLTHGRIRVEGSDADEAAGEPRLFVVGEHAEELIEKSKIENSAIDVYRDDTMNLCCDVFTRNDKFRAHYANSILGIDCIDQRRG
jgi:hypothetical protein